jgi:hypothetical protein
VEVSTGSRAGWWWWGGKLTIVCEIQRRAKGAAVGFLELSVKL